MLEASNFHKDVDMRMKYAYLIHYSICLFDHVKKIKFERCII